MFNFNEKRLYLHFFFVCQQMGICFFCLAICQARVCDVYLLPTLFTHVRPHLRTIEHNHTRKTTITLTSIFSLQNRSPIPISESKTDHQYQSVSPKQIHNTNNSLQNRSNWQSSSAFPQSSTIKFTCSYTWCM